MTPPDAGELDPGVEDAIDDRFTAERGPADRAVFWIVLATVVAVGVARVTGHMELVRANADLVAVVVGIAGAVWLPRTARIGVIGIGRNRYPRIRRDENPVGFWLLYVVYAVVFVGLAVAGAAHRLGWIAL